MPIKIFVAGNIAEDTEQSLHAVKENGLDGQELAFVRSVYLSNEQAKEIGRLAQELDLLLSIHASYYINLNSAEPEKIQASKKRILDALERGHHMKARYVVFHPGYYGKMEKETTKDNIKKQIKELQDKLKENEWNTSLAPETTGKKSQFGSLKELLDIKKSNHTEICIDFSHILARNGHADYNKIIKLAPETFHAHYSGIEYSAKGERKHLPIDPDDFSELAATIKDSGKSCIIVCESPQTLEDALKMKKIVQNL